ncbi:MAG: DUF3883 domain-containing protein [Pseudomonadota bacterium]
MTSIKDGDNISLLLLIIETPRGKPRGTRALADSNKKRVIRGKSSKWKASVSSERLIEVKGHGAVSGAILLTPNERRVAEDRRDCSRLYVVATCNDEPELQNQIRGPTGFSWREVYKARHYRLEEDAMTRPVTARENDAVYVKYAVIGQGDISPLENEE